MISEFYIRINLILETSVNVIIIISEICTGATVIGLNDIRSLYKCITLGKF